MYPKTKLLNATPCVKGNLSSRSLSKERGPDPPRRKIVKKEKKEGNVGTDLYHPGGDDAEFFTSLWQGMDLIILMYPRKISIRDKFPFSDLISFRFLSLFLSD